MGNVHTGAAEVTMDFLDPEEFILGADSATDWAFVSHDSPLAPPPLVVPIEEETEATLHEGTYQIYESVEMKYPIAGEDFLVEPEGDLICLRHSAWSILGEGHTLAEAEMDLRREARELAEVLAEVPLDTLAPDLLALREYVFAIA